MNRQKNDLDSSPVSVDFSDYFDKEKQVPPAAAPASAPTTTDAEAAAEEARAQEVIRQHRAPSQSMREALRETEEPSETALLKKEAHDPSEDYAFDSSSGKLFRLMEDT